MNAEVTADNRSACAPPDSVLSTAYENQTTHEDKRRVQVLILPRIISVKLFRFLAVHSEEVDTRVIGSPWVEEFLEGRMQVVM